MGAKVGKVSPSPKRAQTPATSDERLAAAIENLLRRGDLDRGAPAYGVALNVIHTGYDKLTTAQKRLYDSVVVPALAKRGR